MEPKEPNLWDEFKPVGRKKREGGSWAGFIFVLLFLVAVGAGVGAVGGFLYQPGTTRSQKMENLIEDTPEQGKRRALIGALIGGTVAGVFVISIKVKTMKE